MVIAISYDVNNYLNITFSCDYGLRIPNVNVLVLAIKCILG